MKEWLIRAFLTLVGLTLRFRYRIKYKGLDAITEALKDSSEGVLFLPNHPAMVIDPLVITVPLVKRFSIRPLIIEYMYYHPLFNWAVRAINALPIPNFSTGFNPLKLKRTERMLEAMSGGLKKGERFLIYPSGTTKLTAKEIIGGAFGVHQLIHENPSAKVVLVRMTGLWGSGFSRALTAGASPDIGLVVKKAFFALIKNGLFFVPKREVLVEFEFAGPDFPFQAPKNELNRYLEQWYNKPFGVEGEPLKRVSYCFWKEELPEIGVQKKETNDISSVPEPVKQLIIKKIAELAKVPPSHVLPDLFLAENLGLDSLDAAELISFLEDQFDVEGIIPEDLTTVSRLFLMAIKAYGKKEMPESTHNLRRWNKARKHIPLTIPEAKTIPEAFFKVCDGNLFKAACADPIIGVMSYYKLKRSVLILSEKIKKLPGERIGVLLPSSSMAFIVILACQLAKKIPVMINWTVGGKHLDAVVQVSSIQAVLSSWTFLDKLENVDLSSIEKMLIILEELKAEIRIGDIFKGSLRAFLPSSSFAFQQEDDEAVVLFTSGTEGMPKGVPLTHKNVLSNQRAALEAVGLYKDDILLGFLPPFHSFGFSVTGLLPLLSGLKVVYYPNPTDSKKLSKAIDKWKVTIMCGAPTFLKNILNGSQKATLTTLRMIISGAEKASEELYMLSQKLVPQASFCEGYGITECSPVLTVNRTGEKAHGVGKAISGVEILIIDADHLQDVKKANQVGLVLVRGPNVFSGYLKHANRDPFVEVDTQRWYQTGDLGCLTEEGNLLLSGRLKRFVKIGGEMVSLAAIEEALSLQDFGAKKGSNQEQFVVCTSGDILGKVQLILFSIYPLEVVQVNQMIRKCGFSNIVKIDRVIHLETIPQTATGKVAYRQLEKMIGEN